jgi:hypothetical protein
MNMIECYYADLTAIEINGVPVPAIGMDKPAPVQRAEDAVSFGQSPPPTVSPSQETPPPPTQRAEQEIPPRSPSDAPDTGSNVDQIIRSKCQNQWPNDFRMQAYCESKQREGVQTLAQGRPKDVQENQFAIIRQKCSAEWPDDFGMRAYCESKQREGVQTLAQGRPKDVQENQFAIIRQKCSAEWPNDFGMRAYCESQQYEAVRQLRELGESESPAGLAQAPSSPKETAANAPKEAQPLPKPAERTPGRNSYEGCVIMTATVRTVYEMEQVTEESCRKLRATAMQAPTFERQALTCTTSAGVMYNQNRGRLDLDPLPPETSARIMKGCIMMITDQSEAEYEAIRKRMR